MDQLEQHLTTRLRGRRVDPVAAGHCDSGRGAHLVIRRAHAEQRGSPWPCGSASCSTASELDRCRPHVIATHPPSDPEFAHVIPYTLAGLFLSTFPRPSRAPPTCWSWAGPGAGSS
jgi:hypothetical protein